MGISYAALAVGLLPRSLTSHLVATGDYQPTPREHACREWTPQEDELLRQHYRGRTSSAATIGGWLKRSRSAIIGRAYRLGLCKPPSVHRVENTEAMPVQA